MTSADSLAVGLGTRLRSVVPDLPKPMAPIAGRPFLAHLLDQWIAQGVDHFVLSVGYRCESIVQHFGDAYRGARLEYAVESTPLGTGGALSLAATRLATQDGALLLNGDTYFEVELDALQAQARRLGSDWCMGLFRSLDPVRYMGVALDGNSRVSALRSSASAWANGGVCWFRPAALREWQPQGSGPWSLDTDVFPQLHARGQRFVGLTSEGPFIDIGVPDDYRRADRVLPPSIPAEPRHVLFH